MPIALEVTLIVVLIAIAVGLVPLLFQLRRTAKGLDILLVSLRTDLSQISEDVHASRLRMDLLASTLKTSLDDLAVCGRLLGEVASSLQGYNTRFHRSLESTSRYVGVILGGVSAVLAFFKRKPTPPQH